MPESQPNSWSCVAPFMDLTSSCRMPKSPNNSARVGSLRCAKHLPLAKLIEQRSQKRRGRVRDSERSFLDLWVGAGADPTGTRAAIPARADSAVEMKKELVRSRCSYLISRLISIK